MVQARRRVSYVIQPPTSAVQLLHLPAHGISRLGVIGPLLVPQSRYKDVLSQDDKVSARPTHPRHRLGVASLALDPSTMLTGRHAPEGILYSGGRDGMVVGWDLGIPMKARKPQEFSSSSRKGGRWEVMTGWADDVIDEEAEDGDERVVSDGDVLGDVTGPQPRASTKSDMVQEPLWETDVTMYRPGTHSQFRQCAQAHTDWVNDILLCNYNQTVVSASSDGTIKAWNPHAPTLSDPSTIGSHSDYVRCLTQCHEQNWIASGSFDRTVKLWDLNRSFGESAPEPLITLNPPDATAPKSSVYALAADPFGRTIASGSPERVVRLWDPRTGRRTGKLVGHTDNIRAILISEDSKYLLTGSADATVKLWSLASQRCLHTFTHHAESVWSLSSPHPSLEVFYSGDRSGLVCRVDVEGCSDLSDGDCILLCQDSAESGKYSEGINKIITMDDHLLWTASGSSSIKRWRIPQRRAVRGSQKYTESDLDRNILTDTPVFQRHTAATSEAASAASTRPSTSQGVRVPFSISVQSLTSDNWPTRDRDTEAQIQGIPIESLVKLVSPNDPFTPYTSTRARDPEVATLYSAASVMSVPRTNPLRSPAQTVLQHQQQVQPQLSPLRTSRTEESVQSPINTTLANYEERELAADAVPLCAMTDDIIEGDHGLVRSIILNDRIHALTVDTSGEVAVWDIVRGVCRGKFPAEDVAAVSLAGSVAGESGERERSPREALEAVRERIEGEAVIAPWCSADTKTGVLTIHVNERQCFEAEVYADEVGFPHDQNFNDESKLNIGKWILKNLFSGFIREEQRLQHQLGNINEDGVLPPSLGRHVQHRSRESNTSISEPSFGRHHRPSRSQDSNTSELSSKSFNSGIVICDANMVPAIPSVFSSPIRASPLVAPHVPLHNLLRENVVMPPIPQSPAANSNDATPVPLFPLRTRAGTVDSSSMLTPNVSKENDYFSMRTRQQSLQTGMPSTPDDFSAWNGPGKMEAQTPLTPSGLMGRIKNFGKLSKRPVSDVNHSPAVPAATVEIPSASNATAADAMQTLLQALLSTPFTPPPVTEAPGHSLPPHTTIIIAEDASPSFGVIYRGTVLSTRFDAHALESAMPMWLLECLLLNKTPLPVPQVKLSFILLPWNKDPEVEPLPELLNTTQSKLTANRSLRIRKIVVHVQDKINKVSAHSRAGSIHSSLDLQDRHSSGGKPPDTYDILCNDALLPLDMTLAAVRQYVWRQSSELVMYYRRKPQGSVRARNGSVDIA